MLVRLIGLLLCSVLGSIAFGQTKQTFAPFPAPTTCYTGRTCLYVLGTDGQFHVIDSSGVDMKLQSARAFRTSANCSALSTPANGDVCYDTGLSKFRFYSAGWTSGAFDDALLVHKSGIETITGDKTFTGTNVIWDATIAAGGNWDLNSHKIQDMAQGTATGEAIHAGRTVSTTSPLTGGGDLTTNRTLSIISGGLVYGTITGAAQGIVNAGTYLQLPSQAPSITELFFGLATRAGFIRNLYCRLGTAPGGADTVVFTARIAAADSALTCTITGAGTTCNDTSNAPAVVAGDRLSIKGNSSAGTAADATCTFEVTN